jgi:hypothetical protein
MKEVEVKSYFIALTKEQKKALLDALKNPFNPFKPKGETEEVTEEEGEQNG